MRRVSGSLAIAGLSLFFVALAWAYTPSHYSLLSTVLVVAMYVLLAGLLHFSARAALQISWVLGMGACGAIGAVAAWHARETTELVHGVFATGGTALAVGGLYYVALRFSRDVGSMGRALGAAGTCAALLPATLLPAYYLSNDFRWHLLRHNKLVGTPLYYTLAKPVQSYQPGRLKVPEEDAPPRVTTPRPERPNVVFILVDTLRTDVIPQYGGPKGLMPALSRFADQGVVFTDVMANASWTKASVASWITGLRQEQHGAIDRGEKLVDEVVTLAEVMQSQGYATAAFITNYGNIGSEFGFDQGFDHFVEVESEGPGYAVAEEVNARTQKWLAQRKGVSEQPLFLYLHYLDPHAPYLHGGSMTPDHALARTYYDNELRYFDSQFAAMLEALHEALGPHTAVILGSDHGEEFGEHGERGHGRSLYREVVGVPAILSLPGERPGLIEAPLEARDFYGLLSELAQAGTVNARKWAAQAKRERRDTSIYLSTEHAAHRPYLSNVRMRGIRVGDDFLIWSGYGDTVELYDLSTDPNQLDNLADLDAQTTAHLMARLNEEKGVSEVEPPAPEISERAMERLRALGYAE